MNTTRLVAFYLVAVCVSVLAGGVLGWNGIEGWNAQLALELGVVAGVFAARSIRPEEQPDGTPGAANGFWEWFTVGVFGLFALRSFCWILFPVGESFRTLSPNNLGDLSLHMTYIRNLAGGVGFWPDNPIFASAKLHYPLGMDLFNSLLLQVGVPLEQGLVWMGLLGSTATLLALWRWGRAFAVAGFLFNGGLAGLAILETFELADFQSNLAWKSIPLSMFVTQRGLLYAIPAGLFLLCSWKERFFDEPGKANRVPFPLELLIYSTLPLFHLHTFLFLSFLLAIWFLLGVDRKELARLVGCALVPATLLAGLVTGLFSGPGGKPLVHWQPGWLQEDQNFFLFWFVNFGLLPLLVAWLCGRLLRNRQTISPPLGTMSRTAFLFVLPATGLFLLSCFVMWAPWAWDNTKFMIWCYLAILPFLWSELIAPLTRLMRRIVCGLLFFSGFLSLLGGLDGSHKGFDITNRLQLMALDHSLRDFPREAVFAACPTWNHPLLLNGRKLAVGYDGHLWSHGVDYLPAMERLQHLMNGQPDWLQAAADLKVRYLFWGPMEQEKWPGSSQPWKSTRSCVAQDGWGAIYDLSPVPEK